jgi:hypothetical protein
VLSAAAARTELLELMQRAAGFRSAEITAPGISQRLQFRSIDFGAPLALLWSQISRSSSSTTMTDGRGFRTLLLISV